MKKRIAALAIGLSALAAMPALAETMRLGDSAAVTGVKDNIVLARNAGYGGGRACADCVGGKRDVSVAGKGRLCAG